MHPFWHSPPFSGTACEPGPQPPSDCTGSHGVMSQHSCTHTSPPLQVALPHEIGPLGACADAAGVVGRTMLPTGAAGVIETQSPSLTDHPPGYPTGEHVSVVDPGRSAHAYVHEMAPPSTSPRKQLSVLAGMPAGQFGELAFAPFDVHAKRTSGESATTNAARQSQEVMAAHQQRTRQYEIT